MINCPMSPDQLGVGSCLSAAAAPIKTNTQPTGQAKTPTSF
jgi:hypothetical protein